jgi:hypothetical protein
MSPYLTHFPSETGRKQTTKPGSWSGFVVSPPSGRTENHCGLTKVGKNRHEQRVLKLGLEPASESFAGEFSAVGNPQRSREYHLIRGFAFYNSCSSHSAN